MTAATAADFLVLSGISKRYGGVRALENVDFSCGRGTIHAVLGENGAGKSTLIKIVAGVVQPDAGELRFDGALRQFTNPAAAAAAGIVCIFQELSLMPDLSVADNISITSPPRRFGMIDARAQRRRAEALLAEVGCEDVNPLLRVRDLPLSRRQMVEIAKALGQKPQLLILDEATSALTQRRRREGLCAAGASEDGERRDPLHHAPHARGRGLGRPRLGVPQRPPHRDLRQGRALDRRNRAVDDRARHRDAISAKADTAAPGAGAQNRESRLGEPPRRHLARSRRRRDRRPRRPRRPGPEDACCSHSSACCAA